MQTLVNLPGPLSSGPKRSFFLERDTRGCMCSPTRKGLTGWATCHPTQGLRTNRVAANRRATSSDARSDRGSSQLWSLRLQLKNIPAERFTDGAIRPVSNDQPP